ncbi:MAG: DHH family phosphoesterase [Syntrophales bacterium]|nr:DHH family phosphoesterase [Syntrophales bacterium]
MRYIIVLENPFLVHCLQEFISGEEEVVLLLKEDFPLKAVPFNNTRICSEDPLKISTYQKLMISSEDRVILHAFKRKTLENMLQPILKVCDRVPIVVLTTTEEMPLSDQINVSYLLINEPLQKKIEKEWLYIRNREWTYKIRELTKDAENILILTHDDPDPDALASGVALRTLLGRNRATAPIGSLGKVTRSENLNMMQFLDIRHTIMDPQFLNNYSMIAMVDVQPPYFGDRVTKADIIFDHHPQSANYESSFKDIRVEYGATSTILTEYLMANNIKLSQRLATALLYGIKADTLMLGREATPADIEAFTHLYPLANHNIIRRIEHPSLEPGEVSSFIKALKKYQLVDKVLFAHIGRVQKEDIIPRLADFCLQIAGAEWSVVSGLFRGNLVISTRNVGHVKSAGEVVKRIFSDSSIAGGHRTMAKVVIPVKDFKKLLGFTDNRDIANRIQELFLKVLKEDT